MTGAGRTVADLTVDELLDLVQSTVPPRLVSVDAAAAALAVSPSQVWDWLKQDRLRSFKVGRRRLIPVAALDEFVADLNRGAVA